MKIAEITYDEYGRYINIDGRRIDVFEIVRTRYPEFDDLDEDEQDRCAEQVDTDTMFENGVTHVSDPETPPHDGKPIPVADWLAQGASKFQ